MEQHETRGGKLHDEMSDVSMSEGRTPTTRRTLTTVGGSQMEMGLSFQGLHSGSTTNLEEEQPYLGHHGLMHKDNPFHSHDKSIGSCLSKGDSSITQGTEFYTFISGH